MAYNYKIAKIYDLAAASYKGKIVVFGGYLFHKLRMHEFN